ncbi:hypothetical protein ALC57_04047 [Trachymyrmex cornetzi]|uniref:Uncharacterized protein n=1 Tax=Trachymyrmex cornetzi TaxID=471704 RepID=A0A151JF05_9HYME|nr:hypothetical protein ALC57_04047 [Trachymyrmex cornetzi]
MAPGSKRSEEFQLFAVNNTVIHTYGTKTKILNLGLRRPFRWEFIVAAVKQPIIGADFLTHHGLLPDLKRRRLLDEQTLLSTKTGTTITGQPSVATVNQNYKYSELLRKYIDITPSYV